MNCRVLRKTRSRLVVVLLICALLITITGCAGETSLAGEYTGTSGSYLKLNKDGTCIYAEDDNTGTGTGTWYVKDGVIHIDVDNLGYVVYGDVSDFDGGILLEANAGSWTDEYFKQQD